MHIKHLKAFDWIVVILGIGGGIFALLNRQNCAALICLGVGIGWGYGAATPKEFKSLPGGRVLTQDGEVLTLREAFDRRKGIHPPPDPAHDFKIAWIEQLNEYKRGNLDYAVLAAKIDRELVLTQQAFEMFNLGAAYSDKKIAALQITNDKYGFLSDLRAQLDEYDRTQRRHKP